MDLHHGLYRAILSWKGICKTRSFARVLHWSFFCSVWWFLADTRAIVISRAQDGEIKESRAGMFPVKHLWWFHCEAEKSECYSWSVFWWKRLVWPFQKDILTSTTLNSMLLDMKGLLPCNKWNTKIFWSDLMNMNFTSNFAFLAASHIYQDLNPGDQFNRPIPHLSWMHMEIWSLQKI